MVTVTVFVVVLIVFCLSVAIAWKAQTDIDFEVHMYNGKDFYMDGFAPFSEGSANIGIRAYVPESWRGSKMSPKRRKQVGSSFLHTVRHELGHIQLFQSASKDIEQRGQEMYQSYFRMPMEFDANVLAAATVISAENDPKLTITKLMKTTKDKTLKDILDAYSEEPYRSEYAKRISARLGRKVTW